MTDTRNQVLSDNNHRETLSVPAGDQRAENAARETYLGDGLYASFDGYQIKLRAPRIGGDHEIYLEPFVFVALTEFAARILEAAKTEGR